MLHRANVIFPIARGCCRCVTETGRPSTGLIKIRQSEVETASIGNRFDQWKSVKKYPPEGAVMYILDCEEKKIYIVI